MMAYHFSEKEDNDKKKEITNVSFLVKTQNSKTSFLHIIVYSIFIILFAMIANFLSSIFFPNNVEKKSLKPNNQKIEIHSIYQKNETF